MEAAASLIGNNLKRCENKQAVTDNDYGEMVSLVNGGLFRTGLARSHPLQRVLRGFVPGLADSSTSFTFSNICCLFL